VRPRLALALAIGLVLAPTSSAKEVGAGQPPVALQVSPAHVALAAPGSRTIQLRNVGAKQVVVETARKALGPRPPANVSLTIVPTRLVLRPGSSTRFTLRVSPRRRVASGDHHVLVLFTARPVAATGVAVRMRLGVVVRVRVPGRIVRSIRLQSLGVRRDGKIRVLLASVANRGNVSEELRGRVTISLSRRGHAFARLRAPGRRELRPGTHTLFRARYAGRVRGFVTAVVTVRVGGASRALERRYRIRL
jgi:hypothetical protein